jgi:tetratricopeptide (TPR) repeat protein
MTFGGTQGAPTVERAVISAPPAAEWPFRYPLLHPLPEGPFRLVVHDLHDVIVNHQTSGTRLVTTQAGYWGVWLTALVRNHDVVVEATADNEQLERHAPEILRRAGVFGDWSITSASSAPGAPGAPSAPGAPGAPGAPSAPGAPILASAFRLDDPRKRLALCIEALNQARTPGALLATASVCMEVNDLDAAARDLAEALRLAPEWGAAHFERGKLGLRCDDMVQASESFRAAAEQMPRFAAAWSNLGATLGELDRPDEALHAFTQALTCDPDSAQTHNNIGVVSRELGRLSESEHAFRRVLQLAPDLAFGYYNLGHTLFLQGRYQAALGAYGDGQARDPERNPVQASRLAMCRLATGDASGAIAELQRATSALPKEYRQQLLADTQSIAWALLTHRPDLAGWQQVHDWLAREQAR